MFKLEFDAANKPLALAIGRALTEYGNSMPVVTGASTTAVEVLKSDAAADVEEYNASETVKLNDSAAGQSESQSVDPVTEETHVQETAQHGAGDVPSVDKNGVPPNWSYCAKAAKPFYASGKMAGQWKKGTKVSQEDYDQWYTAARADAAAQHPANTATQADYDTSNAFAANTEQVTAPAVPNGIGEFIKWTSEMQTAGVLTQADITEAYTVLGLAQKDISPIEPNAQVNITSLHSVLSAKVPM